uniref:Uncharacterized protein n=1 Tax=Arundo donax TaxID=35708 RepID=A0A0A8YQM2_ARUDO
MLFFKDCSFLFTRRFQDSILKSTHS